MTVRTAQLYLGQVAGDNSSHDVYEVPADRRTIIKSLWITHNASAGDTLAVINVHDGGNYRRLFSDTLSSGETLRIDTWWVLNAGQMLALASSTKVLDVLCSGTELDLTP